jgi:tRNA pseudouridine55 synthase
MHFVMTLFGVLNVNKPVGPTSRDVVDRVSRLVQPSKVGHAGTLDPLASGVLVICVGQATRLTRYVQQMPKTYRAAYLLGQRSETDDVEGELVPVSGAIEPPRETLDQVLTRFIGDIQQRPPTHSAIKLAGRRAYKLTRRGIEIELQPRAVTIHSILVRRYRYPQLELDVECGSGTYIRALGRDIGEALGTGAVMTALDRTAIGEFHVDDAVSPDDLTADTLARHLQPALVAVGNLPRIALSEAQVIEARDGRPILTSWLRNGGPALVSGASDLAAADAAGRLVAILYEKRPGELWPRMNFKESPER